MALEIGALRTVQHEAGYSPDDRVQITRRNVGKRGVNAFHFGNVSGYAIKKEHLQSGQGHGQPCPLTQKTSQTLLLSCADGLRHQRCDGHEQTKPEQCAGYPEGAGDSHGGHIGMADPAGDHGIHEAHGRLGELGQEDGNGQYDEGTRFARIEVLLHNHQSS